MMHGNEPALRVVALTRKGKPSSVWTLSLRITNLIPHLRDRGVLVEVEQIPAGVRAKRAWCRRLAAAPYDVAWLHRHLLWPTDWWWCRRIAQRWVFDYDDPVCYSPRNPGHFSWTRRLKFRATVRRVDGVLAASDRLVELALPWNRNVVYAPLSLDPTGYRLQPTVREPSEPFRLLWVGSRGTFRYLEGVRPHLEAIGRAGAQVELVVVGHSELRLENLPVENVAWSPESEARQLSRCHLGLVPLPDDRWAAGKAAMKPLQYMASGMPFLGTPVGGNPRLANAGRNAMLGATPDEWAQAVRRLADDEPRRREMARAAVEFFRDHHSPQVRAEHVAGFFRTLVEPTGERRSA